MPIRKTTPEEIINKSIQVFRRRGYYRTNMNDLSGALGLTKGAFYHHFSGKEELMQKALKSSTLWFEEKVFAIAYAEDFTDTEKLELMSAVAYRAFTHEAGGCFFANTILETAHVEETFLPQIKAFFAAWEKALMEIFKAHYEVRELEMVVQQVIADIEGSVILMQLYQKPELLQNALIRTIQKIKK